MTQTYQNYIDGAFVAGGSATIDVTNPADGLLLARIPDSDAATVDAAVSAARRAQPAWEKRAPIERAGYLRQISAKLREHRKELAGVIVREQGKIQQLAQVEVDFTADYRPRGDIFRETARELAGAVGAVETQEAAVA